MASRSRHENTAYRRFRHSLRDKPADYCVFCDEANIEAQKIGESAHAYVLFNRFRYSLWDHQSVTDHLMIVPKKHVTHLSELDDHEQLDIMKLAADYEAKGYNLYARASVNKAKSVSHQHTHLIKTTGRPRRLLIYAEKPYVRVSR